MRIGFIGLGRMGANMVRRLVRDGHEIVVWTPEGKEIAGEGATPSFSMVLVDKLEKPRAAGSWLRPATRRGPDRRADGAPRAG